MKRYLTVVLILCAFGAQSQYVLKEADEQFGLYNYSRAVKLYTEAFGRKKTAHSAERLGESYRRMFDYANAEQWYATAVELPGATPDSRLQYALVLQNNGRFDRARAQYQQYAANGGTTDGQLLQNRIASCDSAKVWMANPVNVKIANQQQLNSAASDWAPTIYGNNIVFTSDRDAQGEVGATGRHRPFLRFDGRMIEPSDKVYLWTGKNYNHLYMKGDRDSLALFPLDAGTDYHVGASSFTADGKEMFFTLTRIPEGIKRNGQLNTINVETYWSKKDSAGRWSKPVALPFNKVSDYSVGDPFISRNGDTLYFCSNMPGGRGGTDLYRSVKGSGTWSTPENLASLNTAGNERSPVMDALGNLYFASDGRVGMGGLDIYRCTGLNSAAPVVENFKYPINSPKDDFAFSVRQDMGIQYFSSNRDGGLGADDIYSLDMGGVMLAKKPVEVVLLSGIVYDQSSRQPMAGALVTLQTPTGPQQVATGTDGGYSFTVQKNTGYALTANKQGYVPSDEVVKTDTASSYRQDIYLAVIGQKEIVLRPIYYDFDRYNIRPDAARELDRLVVILKENPNIAIILGSHTDSRGMDAYNLWLSQKRAESAVGYLTGHGIAGERLTARGYGETMLLNRCRNGIICTIPEHQLNRRTEFKIRK